MLSQNARVAAPPTPAAAAKAAENPAPYFHEEELPFHEEDAPDETAAFVEVFLKATANC